MKAFYREQLALLHNQHYSDFVERAAPRLLAMLRAARIRTGAVLDLGCGGGQLSRRLLESGYTPVGVDVSPAMTRIARKRTPGARFITGSIAKMRLPECETALAVGEVFNYLSSKAEITSAFRNVFRALKPGGLLIFDVREPLPEAEKNVRSSAKWGLDWAILVEVEEDPSRNRLVRRIVSFRRVGKLIRREAETHRQIILPADEVAAMLRPLGYSVRILEGYGRFRLSEDRKVLVATKLLRSVSC